MIIGTLRSRLQTSMQILDFSSERATSIREFQSLAASALPLGHGNGEAHAYCVYVEAGGRIGPHPTGFGQLFLIVHGSGWVAGADGVRISLRSGQGAYFPRGEMHEKGSETGMTAVMLQVADLEPDPEAAARVPRTA